MLDAAPHFLPTVFDGLWMEVETLGEPDTLAYLLFVTADDLRHEPLTKRIFLYGNLIREGDEIVRAEVTPLDARLLDVCRRLVVRLFLDKIPYVTVEPNYHERSLIYRIGRSATQIDFIVSIWKEGQSIMYENGSPVKDVEWAGAALLERVKMHDHHNGLEKIIGLLKRRGYSIVFAPGLNHLLTVRATVKDYAAWLRSLPSSTQKEAQVVYGTMVLELF
jgi:hypothetical protein